MQTLLAFESAARHRSYSHAANELGLTHGAISQRIRDLEKRVSRKLFARVGASMVPTDVAQSLLAQLRPALELVHRAFVPDSTSTRSVRISVLPAFATHWLLPRLKEFRERFPDTQLEIDPSSTIAMPEDGFDLAIRYGPGDWPGIQSIKLCDEFLSPVCTAHYRDVHSLRTPADLSRATLIRNPWQSWTPWFLATQLPGCEPLTGPIYCDTNLVLQAVRAGEGVALGRELLVRDSVAAGELVQPFDTRISDIYAYYLVILKNAESRRTRVSDVRDWLLEKLQAKVE
jgi:LysR family transcriptional regulator, glycine cleavage system transcriptional activator